jgi:hypothetical protein
MLLVIKVRRKVREIRGEIGIYHERKDGWRRSLRPAFTGAHFRIDQI